jgi:hypothetical protein
MGIFAHHNRFMYGRTVQKAYADPRIVFKYLKKHQIHPGLIYSDKILKKVKWAFDEI